MDLSHSWRVDDRYCIDPVGVLKQRAELGLPRFESFVVAERGLKPTFARVLMSQKDVKELFQNDRSFNRTLTISDSRGREFKFKNLGLHFVESAYELIYESPDDPMIVTLTDSRRFLGTTQVDKRYNVLHPVFDGETYYASTLKADGEEKRPWNWIEVIKNIWEIAFPDKPLYFTFADLDVDPTSLEVNTTPDDDDRLLAQPVNLKLRGSFYGVMSWIAQYLGHEFLYDGINDVWTFERFKVGEKPLTGIESWQKFVEDNLDIYVSNQGIGVSPTLNAPGYYNTPKRFTIRFPKANYDFNAGQADEDSDLSYHSLNKYLDKTIDNPFPLQASSTSTKVLQETVVAIYETNGSQSDEEEDRVNRHAKKRAHLIASEYALSTKMNRARFGGIPNGWTTSAGAFAAPVFNQHVLALSFRHIPGTTGESFTICEVVNGSNRLDDFNYFYRRYGRDFAEFRKEYHEENFWEPNEEYVGHHRAYVKLNAKLEPNQFVEATLLRFERTYNEDPDPDTITEAETSDLVLQVGNPYPNRTFAEDQHLWVDLNRQAKSWIPHPNDGSPCGSNLNGQIEVIDSTRGVYMDQGYAVIATRILTVTDGVICECVEPDPQAATLVCTGERRIALCPADCESSVGDSEACNNCLANRDDWPELEGDSSYPEQLPLYKVTISGFTDWSLYNDDNALIHTSWVSYHAGGYSGYPAFLVDGGSFKYPSIYYGAFFDAEGQGGGWASDEEVGMIIRSDFRIHCIDPYYATEENIGLIYPDLVGVGGFIINGVYTVDGIGNPGFGSRTYEVPPIQVPFDSTDPLIASGTYEAPNGTTYTFTVECAGTPVSVDSGGGLCCDPMPDAADIGFNLAYSQFGDPSLVSNVDIVGGDDGEYVSATKLSTVPDVDLFLFFKCENGSIHVWAEDGDGNVYEITTTTSFNCDFATEGGAFFSVGNVSIPELNLHFDRISVIS